MRSFQIGFILLIAVSISACGGSGNSDTGSANSNTNTPTPLPPITVSNLHALADFPIGAAVPAGDASNSLLTSQDRQTIVNAHFSSLTAENIMKPSFLHPSEATFFYDDADALIDYANANGMTVHGHTLLWHSQVPDWMVNYVGDQADWIAMMEDHVSNVAEHFAGDVVSWDVLNEAFEEDGSYRQSFWYDHIGAEYIERAFNAARAADPDVDLYYNDYNLSYNEDKLNTVLDMVEDFQNRGIPIDGIGFQMHTNFQRIDWPDIRLRMRDSFAAVVALGLKVRISELDVSINTLGTLNQLTNEAQIQQAEIYQEVVEAYMDSVPAALRGGITVWGITDADSWVPSFGNRSDWPLLFHGNFQAKQALQGFADGLTGN